MTLKPLTFEGQFECGILDIIAGRAHSYTPVIGKDFPIALGCAIANEQGYYPIPEHWCHADTWAEMDAHADELNEKIGHDRKGAALIIASTMRNFPHRRLA